MSLRYALELHDAGMLIGAYRVIDVIGYGGFGAVYQAEHTQTGQQVALKQTFDPRNIRTFQSEFTVLHRLSHDHLPHYYEMFEEQGNGYLVMELISGQSLLEVFLQQQNQPLTEGQVRSYAAQLCNVLAYLHNETPPLIHRDIKPDNIRLTPEGLIKLVDFGLLKEGVDTTRTSRMGLTPAYAPLEQWGGTNMHTSPQSDIYSLGATFYHLLTAQPPFAVTDRIATASDPLPPPRDLNPRVSDHVSDALMKALAIYPHDRFADAVAFEHALVGTASPTPYTSSTKVVQPPPPSRKRFGTIAMAVVLIAALAVGAFLGIPILIEGAEQPTQQPANIVASPSPQQRETETAAAIVQATQQATATLAAQTTTAQAMAQATQQATATLVAQTATAQYTATVQAAEQETAAAQTAAAQAAQQTIAAQQAAQQTIAAQQAAQQTIAAQQAAQQTAAAEQETAAAQTAAAQTTALAIRTVMAIPTVDQRRQQPTGGPSP
jgi:serine/threonine protein kinase